MEIRDAVLVADGDNEIGQVIVISHSVFYELFRLKKFNWLM